MASHELAEYLDEGNIGFDSGGLRCIRRPGSLGQNVENPSLAATAGFFGESSAQRLAQPVPLS